MTNEEMQEIVARADDEYGRLKDRVHEQYHEIERLNTNLEVASEDLTRIAQLLDLEEGCTIYDIEDKIGKYKSIIKEVREYIHKNCILSDEWTDLDFCNFIPTGKITYKQLTSKKVKGLLKILDKENNETNEVISVEELEKYEPKNMAELEYQEWFWEDNE